MSTLQALLPAIFQIITYFAFGTLDDPETTSVPNLYIILLSWRNTIHPLICFIVLKPLRSAFRNLFKRLFCLLTFKQVVHPKVPVPFSTTVSVNWSKKIDDVILSIFSLGMPFLNRLLRVLNPNESLLALTAQYKRLQWCYKTR